MGRNNFTADLPPEIFVQLRRRLIDSQFSHYIEHAEWLSEMGFPSSKSAIHRYGETLEEETKKEVDLRIRCLEVAAKVSVSDDPIAKAEELLIWVKYGKPDTVDLIP